MAGFCSAVSFISAMFLYLFKLFVQGILFLCNMSWEQKFRIHLKGQLLMPGERSCVVDSSHLAIFGRMK